MTSVGYPPGFVSLLQNLYAGAQAVIAFKPGKSTVPINCLSSLRQGCPLSVALFLIYIDPLLRILEEKLNGITALKSNVKVAGFLDDVTVFAGTTRDIKHIGETVRQFCSWTGAKLNTKKSKFLVLGSWKEWDSHFIRKKEFKIDWATRSTELQILGVLFTEIYQEYASKNWDEALKRSIGKLTSSQTRTLTIHQRSKFINSSILGRCVHLARILPCPESISKTLLQQVLYFIWKGNSLRAKQGVLFKPEKDGGLSLLHPESFFKGLFLRANLSPLLNDGDNETSRELHEYWLAFPLKRELNQYKKNSKAYRIFGDLPFFEGLVKDVKTLAAANTPMNSQVVTNRKLIYSKLVSPHIEKSRAEEQKPKVDWAAAWQATRKLPPRTKELMFRANHDILRTRQRLAAINQVSSDDCESCRGTPEDIAHVFWRCPARAGFIKNVQIHLKRFKIENLPIDNLIHIALPPATPAAAIHLLARTFQTIWERRRVGPGPLTDESFLLL